MPTTRRRKSNSPPPPPPSNPLPTPNSLQATPLRQALHKCTSLSPLSIFALIFLLSLLSTIATSSAVLPDADSEFAYYGSPQVMGAPRSMNKMAMAEPAMASSESMSYESAGAPPPVHAGLGESFLSDLKAPSPDGAPAPERMLLKDGDITLSSPSSTFTTLAATIKETILTLSPEAYIDSESVNANPVYGRGGNAPGKTVRRLHLSARVPSALFDAAFATLTALPGAVVTRQSSNVQDVTSQYIDVSARHAVLASTEAALTKLMARAGTTKEVLEIQRELTRVINEKESNKGQMKFFETASAMSTLRVALEEEETRLDGPRPVKVGRVWATFLRAMGSLMVLVDAAVYSVVWAVPVIGGVLLAKTVARRSAVVTDGMV